jgi:indolepyruvate decarboxylase
LIDKKAKLMGNGTIISGDSTPDCSLGKYLSDVLFDAGVRQIFAVPGDFITRFCDSVASYGKLTLVTLSHEPATAFAAIGAAIGTANIAVVVTTYGAGALNIVNAIAGAFAERIPIVVIAGVPGVAERSAGIALHHQVGSHDTQLRVFEQITGFQAVLDDPATATALVQRAVCVCRESSRPVYLELPRDMVNHTLAADVTCSVSAPHPENVISTRKAAEAITERLQRAQAPVLAVGVEILRQGLSAEVIALAEKADIPMVTTFTGHGILPQSHPRYAGTYLGSASTTARAHRLVKDSDCLVLLGDLNTDTNMGIAYAVPPECLVHVVADTVATSTGHYKNIRLKSLLKSLTRMCGSVKFTAVDTLPPRDFAVADEAPSSDCLSPDSMVREMNRLLHGFPHTVCADVGDCMFVACEISLTRLLAMNFYMSMGFSVPAAIGYQLVSGDRPIVICGDGSFQMTGFELANAIRLGASPIVIVMNNESWQTLTAFGESPYARLTNWNYGAMASVWGCRAFTVATDDQFRTAFEAAIEHDGPVLIDARLSPQQTTRTNSAFVAAIHRKEHLPAKAGIDYDTHPAFAAQRHAMGLEACPVSSQNPVVAAAPSSTGPDGSARHWQHDRKVVSAGLLIEEGAPVRQATISRSIEL